MKKLLKKVFKKAVEKVLPKNFLPKFLKKENCFLKIGKKRFSLKKIKNIYLLGAGKASFLMAKKASEILGDLIKEGAIICHYLPERKIKKIFLYQGGHPLPKKEGVLGAKKILEVAKKAEKKDLILFLLSGGGSDLMSFPQNGISFSDYKKTVKLLKKVPADIYEVNIVRKHIDKLKGGKLRLFAKNAFFFATLALSDVPTINDDPSVIASGPTVPDPSTFEDAINVLKKYSLLDKVPKRVRSFLEKGKKGEIEENPKPGDPLFSLKKTLYLICAKNDDALAEAKRELQKEGFRGKIIKEKIKGEVQKISQKIFQEIKKFQKRKKFFLIFGGEPTVEIKTKSPGEGGRMSYLCALLAKKLYQEKLFNIWVLCGGSDGIDGQSDIAGGIISAKTFEEAKKRKINYEKYLQKFDSATLLKKLRADLKVGPTGTNVADIVISLFI